MTDNEPVADTDELDTLFGDEEPNQAGTPTTSFDPREHQIIRNLAAYLAWHSGAFSDHGITREYVDQQSRTYRTDYHNRNVISEDRTRSTLSIRTQMDETEGYDVLTLDRETISLALHIPSEMQEVASTISDEVFRTPINVPYDEDLVSVTWDNYAAFRLSYQALAHDVQHFPALVTSLFQYLTPVFLHYADSRWIVMMSNPLSFQQPELRLTGSNRVRDVDELMHRWTADDGKLVSVRGMVVQTGGMDVRPIRTSWKCRHCGESSMILADPFDTEQTKPTFCEDGENAFGCRAGTSDNPKRASWIMEPAPKTVSITTERALLNPLTLDRARPVELFIEMRGALTGQLDYGMHVEVVGICSSVEASSRGTKGIERKPLLIVTSIASTDRLTEVEVTDEDRALLREWAENADLDTLVAGLHNDFANHITGLDAAKTALFLQSVGANDPINNPNRPEDGPSGTSRGREIHLTFAGDPGLAKTQLMRAAVDLHPGSQIASGSRCSVAGLIGTAAGNNDMLGNSAVGIKPGVMALVSPGGILGIDELNNLVSSDKKATIEALNEALEEGKVTSAMAFSGTVITKTPVIMVLNPVKGKSDENRFDLPTQDESTSSKLPLIRQIGIPGNTLTRMDLVLCFFDETNPEKDVEIAHAMLRNRSQGIWRPTLDCHLSVTQGPKKWFAMCREILWVEVPEDIGKLIEDHYAAQRRTQPRTNPRWVNSLARLVEATARMQGCCVATREHFDFALTLIRESLLTQEPQLMAGGDLTHAEADRYRAIITAVRNTINVTHPDGTLLYPNGISPRELWREVEREWDQTIEPRTLTEDEMMMVVRYYGAQGRLFLQPRTNPTIIRDGNPRTD